MTSTPQKQAASVMGTSMKSEYRPNSEICKLDPYKLDFSFSNDIVMYKCSCDQSQRLNLTYLCKYCMVLRCRNCVSHEVDSQYCQHCLEYIPTMDREFQMNKCVSCYKCPCCQHRLSPSVINILRPKIEANVKSETDQDPERPQLQQEEFQLICEFCRWSSKVYIKEGPRIADLEVQIDGKEFISELIDYYKSVSLRERAEEKEKKCRPNARSDNTMALLERYNLPSRLFESLRGRTNSRRRTSSRGRANLRGRDGISPGKLDEEIAINPPQPPEARYLDAEDIKNQIEPLDVEFYYRKDFQVHEMSSLEQRFAQIELQPEKVRDFRPISKSLSVKRTIRCKECEHILCKREYNPGAIRFRIQSAAYYQIPELRLKTDVYPIQLTIGQDNIVEFTLLNQTRNNIKVKLNQVDSDKDIFDLVLPPSELNLTPKDDTADYKYIPCNMRPLNKETQITFQSPFKVGFYVIVRPKQKCEQLKLKFSMTHNIHILLSPKEGEKEEQITHVVEAVIGPVN